MKNYITCLCFIVVLLFPTTSDAATFNDVKSTTESGAAISQLADRQIISGYPDGSFRPSNTLTRGQAAKMIANILQVKPTYFIETNFKDITSTHPYYEAITTVAELGIMVGYSDETFRPNATLTRSQAAKIVSEAFRLRSEMEQLPYVDVKAEEAHYYVATLYENKVTKSPGKRFYPNKAITRAQFALFITRAEKQQTAFTMYAATEQFSAFGYTEYDEDIVDVELDLHRLTLHPLQEGTARIALYTMDSFEEMERHFYLVHVREVNDKLVVSLESESIYDHISYATSVYHYKDGLYLKFVPQSFEIYDEFGQPISDEQYDIVIDGEEVEVTMFTDGAFQLYFTNEEERSTHALLSTIENFILDFTIETISPYISISNDDLVFTMSSAKIVDYLNYEKPDSEPFTIELANGQLMIRPTMLGEGVVRVTDENGKKYYIDIIVYEKAGILVVDALWE